MNKLHCSFIRMIGANCMDVQTKKYLKQHDLVYCQPDQHLIIIRKKWGRGFRYFNKEKPISDKKQIDFFKSLAIPPAYTDVKLAPKPNYHILGLGRDSSQKLQYFYHEKWSDFRNDLKFCHIIDFAKELPSLRRKLYNILKEQDAQPSKEVILAATIRILDKTAMRIGNPISAKENQTYGLTTLTADHIEIEDKVLHFDFQGKAGRDIELVLKDDLIVPHIEKLIEFEDSHLFTYQQNDHLNNITSRQINNFLKSLSNLKITAKDFRTWRSCVEFTSSIMKDTNKDKTLEEHLNNVTEVTGNTPAVLKSNYIAPQMLQFYKSNTSFDKNDFIYEPTNYFTQDEQICLQIMENKC